MAWYQLRLLERRTLKLAGACCRRTHFRYPAICGFARIDSNEPKTCAWVDSENRA